MRNKGIVRGIVRAALVTAGVLLIPLWGNTYIDGWNWDWYGFVLAATVVFSAGLTYELLARNMSNRAYRFGVGLSVVTAFALTWVNMVLAADENPANLMYVGVVVIGVIGTAISRLRARGIARAWFGTAVAQMLAPIIAFVFWKLAIHFTQVAPICCGRVTAASGRISRVIRKGPERRRPPAGRGGRTACRGCVSAGG